MKNIYLFGLIIIILFSCQSKPAKQTHKNINREISFKEDLKVRIIDSTGKEIANFNTELADDEYKRQTGLMYRKKMQNNQAMLFVFKNEEPRYFYMKNTFIPLDIIYINRNKEIVSWVENAKPLDETSLPSHLPAQYVLEIKGGLIDQLGIKKGMKLDFSLPKKD